MQSSQNKTRRRFLKNAATIGAGFFIVPRHVLGRGFLAPSDQLTKAIVGLGGMGRGHIPYAGTRVVAICDVDKNHLEKNGLLARNDKLKALLQTANIELNLADVENNLKVTMVNMNIMLGLPEETVLVPDSASLAEPGTIKSLQDYEQLAMQNRKDMQAIGYRKQSSETGIKKAKADYYPSLSLTAGYIAADIPNFVTITNAVTFGVGLSYSVSSLWKTNAHVTEAKAKLAEVQANEEEMNDEIRRQINQAYEALLTANKKIEVSRISIDQGIENYKIVKNKYDNSLLTVTDLLDANALMLQSQISLELAKADAIVAYNTLLERAGVLATTRNIK